MLQFLLTLSDESNHQKIEHIYNTYYDYMMKYAVSKFKSSGRVNCVCDAEDAVQNTFIKIVKNVDHIDFSRGKNEVKNYCFTILSNEICNILCESEDFFEINEEFFDENQYNFIEELEIKENYNEIVKSIERIDEKYSSTLYLYFCMEKSVKEIAELMGVSSKTVYTRLARGKKILLEQLKGAVNNG